MSNNHCKLQNKLEKYLNWKALSTNSVSKGYLTKYLIANFDIIEVVETETVIHILQTIQTSF